MKENLDPGKRLVEKLLSEVDDDKWAKPIAKVLLGEEELDAAIKKMIGDEIEKEFDQTVFSDEQNADELAEELMAKLIANFVPQDVSDTPLEGIAGDIIQQAKDQATQFFKEQIENIQAQAH